MLCAADYVSDDGETAVNLAEVERYFVSTRIREYKQGEMKALRVSRDIVVLSYTLEVSGTEFGNEPAQSCCRQRVGKAPREVAKHICSRSSHEETSVTKEWFRHAFREATD
jgi:hypothetical protein